MMARIKIFLLTFLLWTIVGMTSKIVFLLAYHALLDDATLSEQLLVMWYGTRLDIAIAGYLTLLPGLLLIISLWYSGRIMRVIWNGYFAITAAIAALAYVANIGLYGYWGFPLDNTPLLYLKTSPADAMASLTFWQIILSLAAIAITAILIYKLHITLPETVKPEKVIGKVKCLGILILLEATLILPIRGGIGTGTNHTGSVYFSSNIRLNHAAVNPIFCFIESSLHQEEIGTKYRFMPDDEATALFSELSYTNLREDTAIIDLRKETADTDIRKDTTDTIEDCCFNEAIKQLRDTRPNIILITLEGFSDTVIRVKGVTPNLERLTHEGLYFSNFYANSFRTDRALVSVHSGLPAQTTMSIMDIPRKSTSLPSIAGTLSKNGYNTVFYYGGDINYSNMRSYFMGTGFQQCVSDKNFPLEQHTGKWGVADGAVYDRMIADIKGSAKEPFFYSIMTESSHEPFDVPNYKKLDDEVLNSFAYADECLGKFIEQLKALPLWNSTMVVVVPDHLGAFPANPDNYKYWRYHSPLIITGGVIKNPMVCRVIGSQIDIAATLLGMLGIDHSDFTYSKDMLDSSAPHFAFFTFPDAMGMVTDSNRIFFDNTSNKLISAEGTSTDLLTKKAKAFLQKVYDDLDRR